ncbi:cytochrome P450, partial [Pyrenochaeta sp. MPI-SDFR-AT-0127]
SPPLIPHPYLPFLGHVLGMFWHGARYFAIVNAKTQYPIFTLQTLVKRTVVVIDPGLATVIQKKSPNLTFYGMILEVTKRLVGLDEKTMEIVRWNLNGEHGPHEGLMNESEEMISGSLGPGPNLNALSTTQLEQFSTLLNGLLPTEMEKGNDELTTGLLDFVKQTFTQANAYTVYGPKNPFILHPHLIQSFWTFEAGMIGLMADILPSLTSRRSWKARRELNSALREFVEKGHYASASPMIQKRVAINLKHGFTTTMAGRSELILLFGILGNAVPTTFWFLANIFSRPDLLATLREETLGAVQTDDKGKVVNMLVLKSRCPLIVSTYRETLRQIGNLSSVRLVTGTHTISAPGHAPYVLTEGNMIQIASGVIHVSPATWGTDAGEFNPERWTTTDADSHMDKDERTALPLPKNVPSAAFRAFGGGSVLCPGRHFAMTEILGFVTLCIHMFDITDAQGG